MGWLDGIRRWASGGPSESDLGGQIEWTIDRRLGVADYLGIPAVARARELIVSLGSELEPVAWRDGYPIPSTDQPGILTRPDPAPEVTRRDWLEELFGSCFDHGEALIWIPSTGRNAAGAPEQAKVLPPDEVEITWQDPATRIRRRYRWQDRELVAGRDVIHIALGRRAGELRGRSPLVAIEDALARILAAELYAGDWFETGAVPSITLKYEGTLTDAGADAVRTKWIENHRDHSPAVLPKGWDTKESNVNPQSSQLLETRAWGVQEVARGLGIFPEALLLAQVGGSSLTYQNVAEAINTFVKVTLQPRYLDTIEASLSDLVPGTQAVRFELTELGRLNVTARWAAYAGGLSAGFLTTDQINRWEGWNPAEPVPIPPQYAPTPRPQLVEIPA